MPGRAASIHPLSWLLVGTSSSMIATPGMRTIIPRVVPRAARGGRKISSGLGDKAPCQRLFCSAPAANNRNPVPPPTPEHRCRPIGGTLMVTAIAAAAAAVLAVVAQDHVALRAAPAATSTAHAQLWQGELLEVRGSHLGQLQVYDHRLERAGYIREGEARIVDTSEADAPQLLAVMRFLRDTPGAEALGIAFAPPYLNAAAA